jgi:ATP-binding cassette subfamily B (MDR/TAP) protein 1
VAKGYSQIYGLDYVDTFSPVVKPYSLRTILAIAAAKDLEMIQLDIKTAFLNGDLQEEIDMKQPEGFVIPGKENQMCRLLKSLLEIYTRVSFALG